MKETENFNKSEETEYDEEKKASQETKSEEAEVQAASTKRGGIWRKASIGMATGIVLGGVSSFVGTRAMAAEGDDGQVEGEEEDFNIVDDPAAWSDGEVAVATGVSEDMSFGEAFAAARAEVGPGGAFVWHGNVYNTFTAEEWDSMSMEEREEFGNHFNWSTQVGDDAEMAEQSGEDDEVEVVAVNPEDGDGLEAEADVEVLGVVHDAESGANVGVMTVDGQDVFLIDVDDDGTFDFLATDANQDGQITDNEVVNIEDEQITMEGYSSPEDPVLASNEGEPDYLNDLA